MVVRAASGEVQLQEPVTVDVETDAEGRARMALRREGWNFWEWEGKRVHYVTAGTAGPPLLLIHGFGASSYHWRYNIPELARHHRVYAVDMVGFGWSAKALEDYSGGRLWSAQMAAFITEVIGGDEKVALAGNSLGGFAALCTAASRPELVSGVALLNSAGRFEDEGPVEEEAEEPEGIAGVLARAWTAVLEAGKRVAMRVVFINTKQKSRVESVLSAVYVDQTRLDDDLVESILAPAEDPNAPEVFYRVITAGTKGRTTVDELLSALECPLTLVWGERDPWITPIKSRKIMSLYPSATKTSLDSGHCPHDDSPEEVNKALTDFVRTLQ